MAFDDCNACFILNGLRQCVCLFLLLDRKLIRRHFCRSYFQTSKQIRSESNCVDCFVNDRFHTMYFGTVKYTFLGRPRAFSFRNQLIFNVFKESTTLFIGKCLLFAVNGAEILGELRTPKILYNTHSINSIAITLISLYV